MLPYDLVAHLKLIASENLQKSRGRKTPVSS